jgi:hypothetical protein
MNLYVIFYYTMVLATTYLSLYNYYKGCSVEIKRQ